MNPYYKVSLAAALVATGFGVARLLGEPAATTFAPKSGGAILETQTVTLPRPAAPTAAHHGGMARLVPDFGAKEFSGSETASPFADWAAARLPVETAATVEGTPSQEMVARHPATPGSSHSLGFAPRAKLRNEAPRPLVIEPRARAIDVQPHGGSRDLPAAGVRAAGLIPAAFEQQAASAPPGPPPLAPPLWPIPDETATLRTHIVADGDSLAKLAARYLRDAQRSNEIYELNRGVLASPDLLPIGAELVIPDRAGSPAGDDQSSRGASSVAIHAAANNGLVPVRPVPTTAGVVPRAQLLRPRPVE